jgi:hypothetical protein
MVAQVFVAKGRCTSLVFEVLQMHKHPAKVKKKIARDDFKGVETCVGWAALPIFSQVHTHFKIVAPLIESLSTAYVWTLLRLNNIAIF